jgi:hypothetical protein
MEQLNVVLDGMDLQMSSVSGNKSTARQEPGFSLRLTIVRFTNCVLRNVYKCLRLGNKVFRKFSGSMK